MRYVGFSEYGHDANLAIIEEDGTVVYASASERYSGIKNDPLIDPDMWRLVNKDDHVTYAAYPPSIHQDFSKNIFNNRIINSNIAEERVPVGHHLEYDTFNRHHLSHLFGAYATCPWDNDDDIISLSVDNCGEIEATLAKTPQNLWTRENEIQHLHPESLGAIYSAVTRGMGYTENRDEYIVMGLAAYGKPIGKLLDHLYDFYYFWKTEAGQEKLKERENPWESEWRQWPIKQYIDGKITRISMYTQHLKGEGDFQTMADIAASVQYFFEDEVLKIAKESRKYGSKLVYSGGCAQNVVANSKIRELFDDMFIPTAPHDGGNGLGAAARTWMEKTGGKRLKWSPYSGHNIERELNPKEVAQYLVENRVCGVANGKAEYGPRALGNRSLIADVRYDVKDTVNDIKRRHRFRPFAPAILSEFAHKYFAGPMNEYMQYTADAKHDYSSVTHIDGTARVQLVKPDCESKIRQILEEYYELTGVPMLLNTSLNIRNRPMVNTLEDAIEWEKEYKVKVF